MNAQHDWHPWAIQMGNPQEDEGKIADLYCKGIKGKARIPTDGLILVLAR